MAFRLSDSPIKTGHLFIGAAIILGLITVMIFASSGQGDKKTEVATGKFETKTIVVPQVPISKGQTLTVDDVTAVEWPADFLPTGITYERPMDLVGRVAKQDMLPGEPIFKQKVSGDHSAGGMPAVIPKGHRAVTVKVSEIKGVAGFVKPGDHVDVLTTFNLRTKDERGEEKSIKYTQTVLQDVLVLASAQTMVDEKNQEIETPDSVMEGKVKADVVAEGEDSDDKPSGKKDKKKEKAKKKEAEEQRKARDAARRESEKKAKLVSSVTLAVGPQEAQILALSEEAGELRLSLRADDDHTKNSLDGLVIDNIISTAGGPVSAPSAPPSIPPDYSLIMPQLPANTVELIQGSEKSAIQF